MPPAPSTNIYRPFEFKRDNLGLTFGFIRSNGNQQHRMGGNNQDPIYVLLIIKKRYKHIFTVIIQLRFQILQGLRVFRSACVP
ncbi:hypothetical protein PILCRDRAFT_813267 [Piloderma croceum F 1598]|uniref:Uncharacterized protein n=1 Tax=Piloderma croceum (strain F 1598) TaxID=765440 RepID=A0A0C3CHR9_PILCF|nr:hypothetical protein PILCRDRAFT_813267 [Piloderma croceum F 1598]